HALGRVLGAAAPGFAVGLQAPRFRDGVRNAFGAAVARGLAGAHAALGGEAGPQHPRGGDAQPVATGAVSIGGAADHSDTQRAIRARAWAVRARLHATARRASRDGSRSS